MWQHPASLVWHLFTVVWWNLLLLHLSTLSTRYKSYLWQNKRFLLVTSINKHIST
jgi:hypothetical protein